MSLYISFLGGWAAEKKKLKNNGVFLFKSNNFQKTTRSALVTPQRKGIFKKKHFKKDNYHAIIL